MKLVIYVEFADDSDLDWVRQRAVPAVEEVVDTAVEEERLDGDVHVYWDTED